MTERFVWWVPFLLLSFFGIAQLYKTIFPQNNFWYFAPVLFLSNTYVLMMIGGGQIAGVGLSYALVPFILAQAIKLIENVDTIHEKLQSSIVFSLLVSLQLMFDMRITYLTLFAVGMYFFYTLIFLFKKWKDFIWVFILPGLITFLLHAFWIIPLFVYRQNPIEQLGSAYSSVDAVKFFSFGFFENSLSLLHPNWPENIFGKVGFMRPEFLILPLLAYVSLLFIKGKRYTQSEQRTVLFFVLLGLIGAFLAKGANEPFGGVYVWLFEHVPGFIMFRDSTKWYTLIAVSYSVLIPFSLYSIYTWLKKQRKFQININHKLVNTQNLFLLLTTISLLLLLRPALLGQLTGTFKQTTMPDEYIRLNDYLDSDHTFGRTLWIPTLSRFADYKLTHPVVFGTDFFRVASPGAMVEATKVSQKEISNASIKYVIVPFDSLGELFLEDRKYDAAQYVETIATLEKIPWLQRVSGFNQIAVFRVSQTREHFWSSSPSLEITYRQITPTEYRVELKNARKGESIIFAESFDSNWIVRIDNEIIRPQPYEKLLNSFTLPRDGNYSLQVLYTPQDLVWKGLVVSLITASMLLITLLFLLRNRNDK